MTETAERLRTWCDEQHTEVALRANLREAMCKALEEAFTFSGYDIRVLLAELRKEDK